ncbi:hypothetical protein SEA_ATUIN_255 [Arthrobacter phage Atuin]|nr:hypothetical protein SEA_ATUIN_54 [Arthrobacter phage Atuin]
MSNHGPEFVLYGVTYPNLTAAFHAWNEYERESKDEDGNIPPEVEAHIKEGFDIIWAFEKWGRNAPAPEGQDQKTYTKIKGYDALYDVSHTYDSKGVKVQVGDLVTYKKGHTQHRITDISYWMGRESISIQRQTNSKHGGVKHSFCGSEEIHAVVFDGRVARG